MTGSEALASSRLCGKSNSLCFGVMCNGTIFQRWQADALKGLEENGHHLTLLILDERKEPETTRFMRFLTKRRSTFLYTFLENRIFKPDAKGPVDLHGELRGTDLISCKIEKKGYSEYFSDEDIDTVSRYQLDFILRFGFNIIRGGILSAARFGVWSFHHDDEMKYRGGPPGFWEIFRNDPVNGAIMQRITDKLDGGIILKKGYMKTVMHSYRENWNQLLSVSSSWPALIANELAKSPDAATALPHALTGSKTTAPVYKVPENFIMIKFLWFLLRNRILFYYRDLLTAEIWNVGIIRKPIHEVALKTRKFSKEDITWLPPVEQSGYLADPAGFMVEGNLHILAEDYSYATQKAAISEIVVNDPGHKPDAGFSFSTRVKVMNETTHLSYPFILQHNNEIYCIPESCQSSKITLFRRHLTGGGFKKEKVLLEGISAVDPTLFFYNELWWLFYTDRRYSNTHLYLYYADELTGVYKPHRLNPVKIDIRSSRPAGSPFIHEGMLYRPAQDCSVTYGGRVAINRVLKLTPDEFTEETVNFVEPLKGSKYGMGLHTISPMGSYTLIDGKKYKLNRLYFIHRLRDKLSRKDTQSV